MAQTIAVIGGGAAGFFGAITCAQQNPENNVLLFEKTGKLLTKVLVSGGGRCNVTHHCFNPAELTRFYPRGGKQLKKPFQEFGALDTVNWFEKRGVKLKTEADGRMFPVTDNSETIANCLLREARNAGIEILTHTDIAEIKKLENNDFELRSAKGKTWQVNKILVTTGGQNKPESYEWLKALGHKIEKPVPSLFTFNVPDSYLKELMGISVPLAVVKISGQKLESEGPLLITHWGFSGPAVLRLSAWGARILNELNYHFNISINWVPDFTEETLRAELLSYKSLHGKKIISSNPFFGLPQRLWKVFTDQAGISADLRWLDISNKSLNKLLETLFRGTFEVKGKTTFKEEFVTCGGVALSEVNMQTMESRHVKGLYFAGEVLDIDGLTGGFNFQAAWTTGFLAGKSMGREQ
ncbi:NAD(P)/FAD-dependent oxidoreductase [Adhaeribacter sp. BT258]|uniref:NAD(P)/FAD-dependent oxidoreductase n=1 Tax=Adhaeribacter terrigena TaxID=2793070 RepID=A0ABS1C142_9BACT|nr:NAD(P)/FAD-dependent oxidoreductase [Adhaeribacter terrigena]MBK0403120.1 NAD(P)/FAD-dependent oxidoreductase [Adhaeribacter terrigena]